MFDLLLQTFNKIKNSIDNRIFPYEFLNSVYEIYEQYFDNIKSNPKNSVNKPTLESFTDRLIFTEIGNRNVEIIGHYINLIQHYELESIKLSNVSDEKLKSLFDINNIGLSIDYSFVINLFEYLRRYDSKKYGIVKGVILFSMLCKIKIYDFILFNKNETNIVFESNDIIENYDLFTETELTTIVCLNDKFIKKIFKSCNNSYSNNIFHKMNKEMYDFKESHELIIFSRTFFYNHEKETLEEISAKLNPPLTRERVRQIESKCERKLASHTSANRIITEYFYSIKNNNSLPYLSFEEFYKNGTNGTNNKSVKYAFAYIEHFNNSRIKSCPLYQIVYDSCITNRDELVEKINEDFGMTLVKDDYEKLEHLKKQVVNNDYNKRNNGNYIKKGVTKNQIIMDILGKYFSNGYHASQLVENDDYKKLISIMQNEYGLETDIESPRNIAAHLDRMENAIAIDRGIYKRIDEKINLSDELVNEIFKYIKANPPVVRYQAILNNFKEDFEFLNISNQYYVKSVIDPYILNAKVFGVNRDYVSTGEGTTFRQAINKEIDDYPGIFSQLDLLSRFDGTKSYVFDFTIAERDDIVLLENKNYIRLTNIGLSENVKQLLKKEIDLLMEKQSEGYITSRKLFSRIKILNKEMLEEIPIINNQFRLFSLIQTLYRDEFYFRRPIIGKDKSSQYNSYTLICEYVKKHDSFDNNVVKEYANKNNIRELYSYLEFMIDMSDDYVQISAEKMIKKSLLNINQFFINKLKNAINYYIDSFGSVDTRTYRGYSTLPKINWEWNKYLLVGIIRTYLFDEYDIEYTDAFFNKTDFIVRRNK